MGIGETVDGSVNEGPTRGSTCHIAVRIGSGGDGANGLTARDSRLDRSANTTFAKNGNSSLMYAYAARVPTWQALVAVS